MARHWRPAKSLVKMRDQINLLAPNRQNGSDGMVGDLDHQSRASDHNPDDDGVVKALDITHDPASGVDTWKMAEDILKSEDPRIYYVISNGRWGGSPAFCKKNGGKPWVWRKYTGKNPHSKHFHVSVCKPHYDSVKEWPIKLYETTEPVAVTPTNPTVRRGDTGERVKFLQGLLGLSQDGVFGPATEKAVRAFQKANKLGVDGIVGAYTWEKLLAANKIELPKFHSMVPGGFFSATPFDTSINTSVRTNNPGALNVAEWVKKLPGYVGDRVTSYSGASPNSTVIFVTPEDGVAAWYTLMQRYAANGNTSVEDIINTYGGKGQDYSAYISFVMKRTGMQAGSQVPLSGDDETLTKFAKAMFRYEAGRETPLSDAQLTYGFKLARGEAVRV